MALDFATSSHPGVQAQLDRLVALSVPDGRLGLQAIRELLARLGDPHMRLPPVFHVAGTNGKGSTCAFLRAMLEAEGHRVHVTTSPHLVRYNERIRLAGKLIEDDHLAALLAEVLEQIEGLNPSFFEVTIAAAFLAFSREPADACVVEVGMGGRFDATNVLGPEVLAACGIAALGIDHERFLLAPEDGVPTEPMARIAFEKAGIAKKGVPLVTLDYGASISRVVSDVASSAGARLLVQSIDWSVAIRPRGIAYRDECGELNLPETAMQGFHQPENAGLAVAMLMNQERLSVSCAAIAQGVEDARWPARLQCLVTQGDVLQAAGIHRDVWLDGGHNPQAAEAIRRFFADDPFHLIIGMIAGKNPRGFIEALGYAPLSVTVVPVPGHQSQSATEFGPSAKPARDILEALKALPDDCNSVLIAGSLYLAGEVLRLNDEVPG